VGVTRYRFDEERHMLSSSFAKKAQFDDNHWQLSDVTTTHFQAPQHRSGQRPDRAWDVPLSPSCSIPW
jgi:lipopolysaccharide export system permease protein